MSGRIPLLSGDVEHPGANRAAGSLRRPRAHFQMISQARQSSQRAMMNLRSKWSGWNTKPSLAFGPLSDFSRFRVCFLHFSGLAGRGGEIGRASCRERVCLYV